MVLLKSYLSQHYVQATGLRFTEAPCANPLLIVSSGNYVDKQPNKPVSSLSVLVKASPKGRG